MRALIPKRQLQKVGQRVWAFGFGIEGTSLAAFGSVKENPHGKILREIFEAMFGAGPEKRLTKKIRS
jgi:hypothetical protein